MATMKSLVTVVAFIVMNGAGFVGYRAMATPPAAPKAHTVEKSPAREHATHTPAGAPAPAIAAPAPAPREPALEIVAPAEEPAAVIDPPAQREEEIIPREPANPSESSRRRRRNDPHRAAPTPAPAPVREPTSRPAPATNAAPPPATPAAPAPADAKQHLLDDMESNPYKRSD